MYTAMSTVKLGTVEIMSYLEMNLIITIFLPSCNSIDCYSCGYRGYLLWLNPLDPNPAVAARAVFPQSGRSRLEKRPFFHIFPHFSKIEQSKKYLPHIGVQYIELKPMKFHFECKRNHFNLIKRYALVTL